MAGKIRKTNPELLLQRRIVLGLHVIDNGRELLNLSFLPHEPRDLGMMGSATDGAITLQYLPF